MNLTVNGIEYAPINKTSDVRVVILQRGWVMVGRYARNGDDCTLTDASVIRVWGTKRGLGEITESGPTKDTVLDPVNGSVSFHVLTEIATLSCNEAVWAKHLK